VVLGQLSRQGHGLLIVGIVALQQGRDFAAALAGENDELHNHAEDAADFVGHTPYCAQLVIGQDALAPHFLALLVVLEGIGFEVSLGDCPVEEDLGVDSRVVLLGRGVLQPGQFLGNIQLGDVAEIGIPKGEVGMYWIRRTQIWTRSAWSLKTERTARKVYRTRDEAKADVFDYIERFYNLKRRHSTIGYLSSVEFERKAGLA
jgi:hypothetical protein